MKQGPHRLARNRAGFERARKVATERRNALGILIRGECDAGDGPTSGADVYGRRSGGGLVREIARGHPRWLGGDVLERRLGAAAELARKAPVRVVPSGSRTAGSLR